MVASECAQARRYRPVTCSGSTGRGPHVRVRLGVVLQPGQPLVVGASEAIAEVPEFHAGHVLTSPSRLVPWAPAGGGRRTPRARPASRAVLRGVLQVTVKVRFRIRCGHAASLSRKPGRDSPVAMGPHRTGAIRSSDLPWRTMACRYSSQSGCSPEIAGSTPPAAPPPRARRAPRRCRRPGPRGRRSHRTAPAR